MIEELLKRTKKSHTGLPRNIIAIETAPEDHQAFKKYCEKNSVGMAALCREFIKECITKA